MYYNCLVNIPKNTGKISKNKRGKTTYIEYTYAREYLLEKKYNEKNDHWESRSRSSGNDVSQP